MKTAKMTGESGNMVYAVLTFYEFIWYFFVGKNNTNLRANEETMKIGTEKKRRKKQQRRNMVI
jgi:hypothetical protein